MSEIISVNAKRKAARILSILKEAGFRCISVPNFPNDNTNYTSAYGCYINYLRMVDVIFLPSFGNKEHDAVALHKFNELFSQVIQVPSREIAAQGGVLNCISWTVKQ